MASDKVEWNGLNGIKLFITGGTGSLGKSLLSAILSGRWGVPSSITVFSRDEAKQFFLQNALLLPNRELSESDVYRNLTDRVRFIVGDVRDVNALKSAMRGHQLVFHAAALKQVPSCELFPEEAVKTNVLGAINVVQAAKALSSVQKCIFISTDKAAHPTNAMGMSKAVQEKIFIAANREGENPMFAGVRYGNVIASRGSVIPVFLEQIKRGNPITITDRRMTRFLLTLDQAVATIFVATQFARAGEIVVPNAISAKIVDIVEALVPDRNYPTNIIGIRPGEKLHEIMISGEDAASCRVINGVASGSQQYFAIRSRLPHVQLMNDDRFDNAAEIGELSSEKNLIPVNEIKRILDANVSDIIKMTEYRF